jgi:hypothetical protein
MTPYQLTRALRRDELTLRRSQVDLIQTIERGSERFHDQDVMLVERTDLDALVIEQAIEVVDDPTSNGKGYLYVPLAFGPVQEVAR